jgi:hypothetical protein
VDFAYDEALPEVPALIAVPRGDGGPPTVHWAATRGLSLAWKLCWLHTDHLVEGHCAGKDLYDAVLLAELPDTRLPPSLLRTVLHRAPDPHTLNPSAIRDWRIDWSSFPVGEALDSWRERLATALEPLLTAKAG